jgi:FMN reductase
MSVVVVGNPKPMSRTRHAAELIVQRLTSKAPDQVIDLTDLGQDLLAWGSPAVTTAVSTVKSTDLLVVASPTFKGTYSGLLKLFLDQIPAGALRGTVAFPVMLGAARNHAMAPELLLRPVLVELGCSCPASGLFLLDSEYADTPELTVWLDIARHFVPAATR